MILLKIHAKTISYSTEKREAVRELHLALYLPEIKKKKHRAVKIIPPPPPPLNNFGKD